MTTDANLVGKGDLSQNLEQSVQNPDSTANQAPPAAAEPEENPNFTADITPGPNGEPISVNLPAFITRHLSNTAQYSLLQRALKKVFRGYYGSDEHRQANYTLEEEMAFHALELSLRKVFEWGAEQALGTLPDEDVLVSGNIKEIPYPPQTYEALSISAGSCHHVGKLHNWVRELQDVVANLGNTNTGLSKIIANGEKIEATQQQLMQGYVSRLETMDRIEKNMQQQLDDKDRVIERLRARLPGETAPKESCTLKHGFNIISPYNGTSQAEILFFALQEYRDSRKKDFEGEITDGDVDSGYASYQDYQGAQDILDELTMNAFSLAENNRNAATYQGMDTFYREQKQTELKWHAKSIAEFAQRFGMALYRDDTTDSIVKAEAEEEQPATDPVATTTETSEQTPES